MSNSIKRSHWLYLLAALLLFMQTFALWHDATHPFHLANVQCEQIAAVGHTPAKLSSPVLLPSFIVQRTEILPISYFNVIERQSSDSHSIRAPPVFS